MSEHDQVLHPLGRGKAVAYTPTMWAFLTAALTSGRPILVGGRTYSGKSALLAALITATPPAERIALAATTPELVHFLPEDHPADNVFFFGAGDRYATSTWSGPKIGDQVGDKRCWKLSAALTSKAAYAHCTRLIFDDVSSTDNELYQYLRAVPTFGGAAVAAVSSPDIDSVLAALRTSVGSLDHAEAQQVLARAADVVAIMDRTNIDGATVGYVKDLITIHHGPAGMSFSMVAH